MDIDIDVINSVGNLPYATAIQAEPPALKVLNCGKRLMNITVTEISKVTPCRDDPDTNDTLAKNISDLAVSLPKDMTFHEDALMVVIVYSILFVIAACGNLTVFITLFRNRHRRSRVNRFILHLSIADMIVTFIMLPLEISWNITVAWIAGDVACRVFMFFRAFGFYLSSFILVTISLDRYFAILHPLSMNDADKRGRIMLGFAWVFSFVASLPQSIIFHVEYHPHYEWFGQCVTFNFFPSAAHELAYNLFNMIAVYGLPLVVIIISYTLIMREMTKKYRESKAASQRPISPEVTHRLRRSGVGRIERARMRTLKMTIVIVLVFILCWTPYFVMSAWWWFDKETAERLDTKVQRALFLFAVSNSCMDPIVYGMFTINFKKEFSKCCPCYSQRERQYNIISAQFIPSKSDQLNGNCCVNSQTANVANGSSGLVKHSISLGHGEQFLNSSVHDKQKKRKPYKHNQFIMSEM